MNRRDFLIRLGGVAAAVTLSPFLDLAPIETTVSGIESSTFSFWRNEHLFLLQIEKLEALKRSIQQHINADLFADGSGSETLSDTGWLDDPDY